MSFRLKVEGGESIALGENTIINAIYRTDTPDNSNARSTEVGAELKVLGKVVNTADGDQTGTIKLAQWSLVPASKADCYRQVTLEVISAGQIIRQIKLPNAFVVDYTEDYGAGQGIGTFTLVVRQKRDKIESVTLEYGSSEAE
ncbi:MAG TPA: membrane-associated protease 1 [Bacillota bacterium]